MRLCAALASALFCFAAGDNRASARADVILQKRGAAWDDATPAAPIGGNPGTTLGDQRTITVERATAIWAEHLDSPVPIVVRATFDELGCTRQGAILGQAGSYSGVSGLDVEGADPALWYPSALANRLAGHDLLPGEPDIVLEMNSSIDRGECREQLGGFYYGLDARAGQAGASGNDLLEVVLHELGHGLGFASFVDVETGENVLDERSDAFTAHIRDNQTGTLWHEMTAAERAQSASHVRAVVFEGSRTRAAALEWLVPGRPSLTLEPAVATFSGFVSDTAFGENAAQAPARGRLSVLAQGQGCSGALRGVRGTVVLAAPSCEPAELAAAAESAGAVGVLLVVASPVDAPARPLPAFSPIELGIPVLTLSASDANAIASAAARTTIMASLGGEAAQPLGADDLGRPLLYATEPVREGSSISHFDPLGRPDLLMEPYTTLPAKHDLDLTLPALLDIGWAQNCGNGQLDEGESCDDGALIDDRAPDRCRSNCLPARCGDGVIDRDEACDDGLRNGDGATACRTDCSEPRCGGATDPCEPASGIDVGFEPNADAGPHPKATLDAGPALPHALHDEAYRGCTCHATGARRLGFGAAWPGALAMLSVGFALRVRARRRRALGGCRAPDQLLRSTRDSSRRLAS